MLDGIAIVAVLILVENDDQDQQPGVSKTRIDSSESIGSGDVLVELH